MKKFLIPITIVVTIALLSIFYFENDSNTIYHKSKTTNLRALIKTTGVSLT